MKLDLLRLGRKIGSLFRPCFVPVVPPDLGAAEESQRLSRCQVRTSSPCNFCHLDRLGLRGTEHCESARLQCAMHSSKITEHCEKLER